MKQMYLIVFVLLSTLVSCNEPVITNEPVEVVDSTGLHVVWAQNLDDQNFTRQSKLSNSGVIVTGTGPINFDASS